MEVPWEAQNYRAIDASANTKWNPRKHPTTRHECGREWVTQISFARPVNAWYISRAKVWATCLTHAYRSDELIKATYCRQPRTCSQCMISDDCSDLHRNSILRSESTTSGHYCVFAWLAAYTIWWNESHGRWKSSSHYKEEPTVDTVKCSWQIKKRKLFWLVSQGSSYYFPDWADTLPLNVYTCTGWSSYKTIN